MTFDNAELLAIEYLNSCGIGVKAYAEVPQERPKRFITVERTGGERLDVARTSATLAVQVWAETRLEAALLADEVDEALYYIQFGESVYRYSRLSIYNYPALESKHYRYQIVIELIISH